MDKSKLAVSTYNKIASKYSELYFDDKGDLQILDKFLSYLPTGSNILDVGCGPGQFSKYMSDKGYRVEGIDLSSEMIVIARKKVIGVNFQLMDMRKLSFTDSFEGILAAYSLIHIESSKLGIVLKEFYKALKSGGLILIIVQKGEPDKIIDELLKSEEKTFINFFTIGRLNKYLNESGFKDIYQQEKQSDDPDQLSEEIIYVIAKKI